MAGFYTAALSKSQALHWPGLSPPSTNYRDSRQVAFTQSDLSLSYRPENGRFDIQAFVRNLENERPLAYAGYIAAGPDDIFNFQFGAPRTYGVRVSVNF